MTSVVQALGQLPGGQDQRVRDALTAPALWDNLETILDRFVAIGVQADFARLSANNVRFDEAAYQSPPARPTPAQAFGAADQTPGALQWNNVPAAQRYQLYFEWFIDLDGPIQLQGQAYPNGVAAFFGRNPLMLHAVERAAHNFSQNLILAMGRILQDWDDIQRVFFEDPARADVVIQRLVEVKSTGSDFHKGGKQVLLLRFQMSDGSPQRLVYKPSSVEIDFRLVGESACLARQAAGPRRFAPHASLSETVNGFLRNGVPRLPTYRILPRALAPDATEAQRVTDPYGYVQFLTNEAAASDAAGLGAHAQWLAERWRAHPQGRASMDSVTDSTRTRNAFYYQVGQLMALATTFSVRDLHYQNMIVHRLQPHLIDLEESFNAPLQSVVETGFHTAIATALADSQTFQIHDDRTANLDVANDLAVETPATSMLWMIERDGANQYRARPCITAPGDPIDPVLRARMYAGLHETLSAFASAAGQAALNQWFTNNNVAIRNTVVRYVPRRTSEFVGMFNRIYSPALASQRPWQVAPPNPGYEEILAIRAPGTGPVDAYLVIELGIQIAKWQNAPVDEWTAMNYVLEHPDHNWRDYLNLDTPAYYRMLGASDLYNSRGAFVDPQAAWEWIQAIGNQPGLAGLQEMLSLNNIPANLRAPQRASYFPRNGADVVRDQVQALANRSVADLRQLAENRMPLNFRPVPLTVGARILNFLGVA